MTSAPAALRNGKPPTTPDPAQLEFQFSYPVSKKDLYRHLYGMSRQGGKTEFLKSFTDTLLAEMTPIWPDRYFRSGSVTGRLSAPGRPLDRLPRVTATEVSLERERFYRSHLEHAVLYGMAPALIIADDIVDIESRAVDLEALEMGAITWNSPLWNTSARSSQSRSSSASVGRGAEVVRAAGLEPARP